MKKIILIVGTILIILLILYCCGCLTDQNNQEPCPDEVTDPSEYPNSGVKVGQPFVSPNQIVVEFKDLNIDKAAVREEFHVEKYETCPCGNSNKELWNLDLGKISVEGAISTMKNEPERNLEGDYQLIFEIPSPRVIPPSTVEITSPIKYTESVHKTGTLNIAILDSGFLPNYFLNDPQFLYNTENKTDCHGEKGKLPGFSGWNFIDHNSDITDLNWHGTYIAKIITSELVDSDVDYRILPLKVFDEHGKGSYWNIVCAMDYLKDLGDIDIVNASFGYYGLLGNQEVLKESIEEMQDRTLIIASSGNIDNIDTDMPGNEHSPSGFSNTNILAVGGFVLDDLGNPVSLSISSSGNVSGIIVKGSFGKENVDLVAPFDGYNLKMVDLIEMTQNPNYLPSTVSLSGTSYGTALVTARTAKLLHANMGQALSTQDIKNLVFNYSLHSDELKDKIDQGKVILRNMP